ncbi:MAG: family 10 glycosylhydrolase [Oscillospiraceae bacterium]|nr:family 10 glycosylhydrolase [Oscillospiraceae bacterium]
MGKRWLDRYGVVVSVALLAAVVALVIFTAKTTQEHPEAKSIAAQAPLTSSGTEVFASADGELRGMWVPYFSLDMSRENDKSEAAFQQKFDTIIENSKAYEMNALIVQVRPFADAFYPSKLFPWSGYLTGTQGTDPGYDPLAYMVQSAHKAGMQLHVWINPLRIQVHDVPQTMADSNPYVLWQKDSEKQDWCLPWAESEGVYFNAGIPEVRQYIADGVREIVENYAIDGVQFDDYFYPTEDSAFDKETYQSYCDSLAEGKTKLSQQEWRRANISSLVSLVYTTIHSIDDSVQFGIAPQGNVENDLAIGADVAAWCSTSGYVDYICPQLYYNFENPTLPYDTAAKQWRAMVTNPDVRLYFGLGVYKAASDADGGTWKKENKILSQQVRLGRTIGCDGFLFYSYDSFQREEAKEEIENVLKVL